MRVILLLVVACALFAADQAKPAATPIVPGVHYADNLARIPVADPVATQVPELLAAMRGQHPRLLFTRPEVDELRKRIASDPMLQKTAEATVAWAKRFRMSKEDPPNIVMSDTPALANSGAKTPALALAYLLDRDPKIKGAIVSMLNAMLAQPYWANAAELDSNMGAGNNMLMVGLLYDAVRDDLDPEFRAAMAAKMLVHVRRMHWLGHKELGISVVKYWQQDTQNNHRWHRNAGMTACLLAIADEPGLDLGYQLEQLKKELDYVLAWWPEDGDCHEGAGYQQFGFTYLALTARMADRVLGTTYLSHPGFRRAWAQQIYYAAPGRLSGMSFGDDQNAERFFEHLDTGFFIGPALSRDADAQAALTRRMNQKAKTKDGKPYIHPWSLLVFYDPTLTGGDFAALPTQRLFADLGAASMRDSWQDEAVALAFKCGPLGGYKLNAYAWGRKDAKGQPHYVNIAHDDPDANGFSLAAGGEFIFHPGLYSFEKLTESQNCLTVDGKGQINEGDDYSQPVPGADMRNLAYLTGWKTGTHGRTIIEGEASGSYLGLTAAELRKRQKGVEATADVAAIAPIPGLPDPVLSRFRRTAVYLPGDYILLLDDLAAPKMRELTWRGTVEKANFDAPADGRCSVSTKSGRRMGFQMLSNQPFTGAIDHLYLDGRWGSSLMQQFQFTAKTCNIRFACLIDPWDRKVALSLTEQSGLITLHVRGLGIDDSWAWSGAPDARTPSGLAGLRGTAPLIALTALDKAPHGD